MSAIAPVAVRTAYREATAHPCMPVLERLCSEAASRFGAAGVRLIPGAVDERVYSYVVRAAVQFPNEDHPRSHLYIKVFKPRQLSGTQTMRERVVRDFETTRQIHDAMAQWDDVGAVRPVACYPEHLAIVTEEALGVTLGGFLGTRAGWFPRSDTIRELAHVMATVGRWVRAFQAIDPQPGRISVADFRDYVDLRLQRLVRETPALFRETDRPKVLAHIDLLAALVRPSDLAEGLVHADLAPGNVVVAGRRVVVLDFAMTHRGSVLQDVSRLYVQLDLMRAKPYFRRPVIRALQKALLRGFDPNLAEDEPLFRLLLLRHHVNHLATLSLRRERFPARAYNAYLRRMHRRWIDCELSSGARR